MAAQRDNDDIAAALHGLAGGHHEAADEHAAADGANADHPAPVAPSPQPPAAPPVARARPALPTARPAAPTHTPAAPPPPPLDAPPAAAPAGRQRAPSPVRPAAPSAAAPQFEAEADAPFGYDASAVPTVDYHSVGPAKPYVRPVRTPLFKTLGFRRTIIPVMLTSGVMMIVMAAARWVVDEEAPLARLPGWVSAVLILTGLLLLALGLANMMAVRADLARRSG